MGESGVRCLIGRVPELARHRERVAVRFAAMLDEAIEAWPAWIDSTAYADHIGELLAPQASPLEMLDALRAGDLYLAAAARHGSAPAIASLEEKIRRLSRTVVGSMGGDPGEADDTAGEVVEKILVGSRLREARLCEYKGRGSLNGWLRAIVSRTFLNSRRKHKREVLCGDEAVLDALEADHVDPAIDHLKSQYRAQFAAAFEAAIASLSDRHRGVLRYRFVDGADIETISAVYRIHRATCHRWLSSARAALAAETEKQLRERLTVDDIEIDSIRALIESQLDLSLSRMFGGNARPSS